MRIRSSPSRNASQRRRRRSLKSSLMLCIPLLFILFSAVIVTLAYSQPNSFLIGSGSLSSGNDNNNGNSNTPDNSGSSSSGQQQTGSTGITAFGALGGFKLCFPNPLRIQPLTMWSSDALGNNKELFQPSDIMYASVQADGQTVTFYVTEHHETWANGDALTDVSGGAETVALNSEGVQTVSVWSPLLTSGCYDVVLDHNNNGIYDCDVDSVAVVHVQLLQVVPEVPFGTLFAAFGMIAGVAGFVGFKHFHVARRV